ncbi:GNAT family N-acetyltransferase [Lysobacter korlensis]|uniref:GNAT family N-acetyltransferase n=1 Tax=Lysobacter korlensis TaxID=553636 RepID=A0ABV6RWB1_9GAMM
MSSTPSGTSSPVLNAGSALLRPYDPRDEDAFVRLFQDPEVSRFVGDGPQDEGEDRALFGRIFSSVYAGNRFAVWAITRGGAVVGHAELKPSPSEDVDGWELVYVLERAHWGQGLGTEVARAITTFALEQVGLPRIYATVDQQNARSIGLLERLGYVPVADRHEDGGKVIKILARTPHRDNSQGSPHST